MLSIPTPSLNCSAMKTTLRSRLAPYFPRRHARLRSLLVPSQCTSDLATLEIFRSNQVETWISSEAPSALSFIRHARRGKLPRVNDRPVPPPFVDVDGGKKKKEMEQQTRPNSIGHRHPTKNLVRRPRENQVLFHPQISDPYNATLATRASNVFVLLPKSPAGTPRVFHCEHYPSYFFPHMPCLRSSGKYNKSLLQLLLFSLSFRTITST